MIIIDRFEGLYAICETEDKTFENILIDALPLGAEEGDCIIFSDGRYQIDAETTRIRKERIRNRRNKLFE